MYIVALALLSISYVIHVFCYAYQLMCSWMPSKGRKNLPQKRRGFFSFPIHLWGENSESMQLSETKESSLLSQRVLKCVLNIKKECCTLTNKEAEHTLLTHMYMYEWIVNSLSCCCQENGASHRGEQETVKLTKDVSWEEEEEEVTEHYLKIYAKYITDGQVWVFSWLQVFYFRVWFTVFS